MTEAISTLLAQFPKQRPPLPARFQEIYKAHYQENRTGGSTASSMAQTMERWLHRSVASDLSPGAAFSTLELGAGTLNQLGFEPDCGPYDVVEPFRELYESSRYRNRVRAIFADVADIPPEHRYDRITSVAALEHICDLPQVMARSALLLNDGGVFRAAIPSEGGLLWRLGWMLTTGLEFRLRYGLDYAVLMAHEHVNRAADIESLTRALFDKVAVRSLGIGRQFSLYRFIAASGPRLEVARQWIGSGDAR